MGGLSAQEPADDVAGVGLLRVVVRHGLTRLRPLLRDLTPKRGRDLKPDPGPHAQAAQPRARQEAASTLGRESGRSFPLSRGTDRRELGCSPIVGCMGHGRYPTLRAAAQWHSSWQLSASWQA
jgi:hypothetical protein